MRYEYEGGKVEMPKKYICIFCKMEIKTRKVFIKHMYLHFKNYRCPICGMKTKHLSSHLSLYHLNPTRKLLLERDLAILTKEARTTKILSDPNLNLNKVEKNEIRRILKKL